MENFCVATDYHDFQVLETIMDAAGNKKYAVFCKRCADYRVIPSAT